MFLELTEATVHLSNVNPRGEKHGKKEIKPATDLSVQLTTGADVLKFFNTDLRAAFYKMAEEGADPDLADKGNAGQLTALRFPKLEPVLKWDEELTGYQVRVAHGIGGDSDIELEECKLDNFKITLQEGGTVILAFRIIAHPDMEDSGKLDHKIQTDIVIDLVPPEPATVQDLFAGELKPTLTPAAAWPFPTNDKAA